MTAVPEPAPRPSAVTVVPAWLLTSAGASAALVGIGYLVQAARDHLLGVELRANLTLADYGLVGARFFVDVITLVLRTIGLHPVITPSLVVIAGGVLIIFARRPRRPMTFVGVMTRFVVIVLLLVTKAAVFDVPSALIENVLVERTDVNRVFDASPILNKGTNALWRELLSAHPTATVQKTLGWGDASLAQRRLDALFMTNLSITICLIVWSMLLLREASQLVTPTATSSGSLGATASIVVLAVAIATLALPYQYGKLVAPTVFNEVEVYFRETDDHAKEPTAAQHEPNNATSSASAQQVSAKNDPVPNTANQPSGIAVTATAGISNSTQAPLTSTRASDTLDQSELDKLAGSSLMLASTSDLITIYIESDDTVRQVSRDDIESVKVYPTRDVLAMHIEHCMRKAGTP